MRQHFPLSQIVYAGAHALVNFLRQASEVGCVEVFVCWEGDYAVIPRVRGERAISSLADEDDWLHELTFTRIAGARER